MLPFLEEIDQKKNTAKSDIKSVLSVLSFKSFMISDLHLSFESILNLFLYMVLESKPFCMILLHTAIQIYQHHLLKSLPSLYCVFFSLLL